MLGADGGGQFCAGSSSTSATFTRGGRVTMNRR
jgi:hypothetical protein